MCIGFQGHLPYRKALYTLTNWGFEPMNAFKCCSGCHVRLWAVGEALEADKWVSRSDKWVSGSHPATGSESWMHSSMEDRFSLN